MTVGQIRERYLTTLERQIEELSGIIRKGYHHRHEAEKFLSETIGLTLTTLNNVDALAGDVILLNHINPKKVS